MCQEDYLNITREQSHENESYIRMIKQLAVYHTKETLKGEYNQNLLLVISQRSIDWYCPFSSSFRLV